MTVRLATDAPACAEVDPKWWVLLAVGVGTFMSGLTSSAINTVLPVVARAFGSDVATIEWVVTVYLLVVSSVLLSFGRLGDLRGHKAIYVSGSPSSCWARRCAGWPPRRGG